MKSSKPNANPPSGSSKVQGEGDYASDRRYTQSAQAFARSGKVEEAARKAKPVSQQEAEMLKRAEESGESHSKGEDPALKHSPPRKP